MLALSSTCPRKLPAMELRDRKLSGRLDPRLEFVGALIVGVMLVMMFAANSVQSIDSGQDHLSNETLTTSLPLALDSTEGAEENLDSSGESRGSLKGQPIAKKTAPVTKRNPTSSSSPPSRNLTTTQHTKSMRNATRKPLAAASTATSSKQTTKAASLSSRPKQTPTSRRPGPKQTTTTTTTSKRLSQKGNGTSTTSASRNKREWDRFRNGVGGPAHLEEVTKDISQYVIPQLRKKDFPCNMNGFRIRKWNQARWNYGNEKDRIHWVTGNMKTGPGDIEQKVLLNFKETFESPPDDNRQYNFPLADIFFDNTISESDEPRDLKGVDKRGLCPYLDNGKLILDERGFYNGRVSKYVKPSRKELQDEFWQFVAPVLKKKGYPCKLDNKEDFEITEERLIVRDRTIRQAAMGLPSNITVFALGKIHKDPDFHVLVNWREQKWGSHRGARREFPPEKVFYDMSITNPRSHRCLACGLLYEWGPLFKNVIGPSCV